MLSRRMPRGLTPRRFTTDDRITGQTRELEAEKPIRWET